MSGHVTVYQLVYQYIHHDILSYKCHIVVLYTGGQPTLIEMVRFRGRERRINIPQEVSTKYSQFGFLLLEDSNGARVRTIEHKHQRDAEQINMEILQQWISGRGRQPVSWETLTEVLRDVELGDLASEIGTVKLQTTDNSDA